MSGCPPLAFMRPAAPSPITLRLVEVRIYGETTAWTGERTRCRPNASDLTRILGAAGVPADVIAATAAAELRSDVIIDVHMDDSHTWRSHAHPFRCFDHPVRPGR